MWEMVAKKLRHLTKSEKSTKMAFEGQGEATSDIVLTQEGNATKVFWTLDTEMNIL
jgi:hypothetical protein